MMLRRAAVLAAVIAMLGVSLGMADNYHQAQIDLTTPLHDTTTRVRDTKLDDTIAYTSPVLGVAFDFNNISGRIVQTQADTSTATGFARDSVYFVLQTKFDNDYDSIWSTIWTSPYVPVASFDSATGYAEGAAMRFWIPRDSVPSMGEQFRVQYYLVAVLDSIRTACGTAAYVDPYVEFQAHLEFRLGGEKSALDVVTVTLDLTAVDSTDWIGADIPEVINDTIYWTSATTTTTLDTRSVSGRVLQVTADTSTQTGLAADSMYFILQTKTSDAKDSVWWTVWQSDLTAMAAVDNSSATIPIDVPVDSLARFGQSWRIRYYLVAEEDSMHTEPVANSNIIIDPQASLKAYLIFRKR